MRSKALLVSGAAALLASCGGAGSSGAGQTSLPLNSTNYVTITQTPTTSTTTTLVGQTLPAGVTNPLETTYVVATGDYPSTIAKRFKVPFEDFLAINGWTLVGDQVPGFPAPGATIKIPPGWTTPGEAAVSTETTPSNGTTPASDSTVADASQTTVATDGSTCPAGEYTIKAGDTPGGVAKALDTTVEALAAANTNTKGYKGFVVGIKIKTPPKADC